MRGEEEKLTCKKRKVINETREFNLMFRAEDDFK